MKLPDIDFTKIRSAGAGGQREGFEQFIAELVAEDPPAEDATFVRLDGAGGDGGVECYWTLTDDTEHGWQAKFWTGRGDVDKAQLDASVATALDIHPKLKHYTIAIPVDPTGPTGRRGQSLLERILAPSGWLAGWRDMAVDRGMDVSFEVAWRTDLIARLAATTNNDVRTRYWFDTTILPERWWEERLDEAIASSRPRYLPELSIPVRTSIALDAICGDLGWTQTVDEVIRALEQRRHEVTRAASEALAADVRIVDAALEELIAALRGWSTAPDDGTRARLDQRFDVAQAVTSEAERGETGAMDAKHGDNWDRAGWRQFQAEYQVSFPAAAVDALRATLGELEELRHKLGSPFDRLPGAQLVVITGAAGTGKTFVTLDHVAGRVRAGRPSLLVHGRWFGNGNPLEQLRDHLQLPTDLTGEEVLGLLDQAGRTAGVPVLLVIDALNETRPRRVWFDQLERIAAMINRHPHLRVVLTVRTHYRPFTVPHGLDLPTIDHRGFDAGTLDALREYADYYGLEPPVAPPVNSELDNPLFLRLLCEALDAAGHTTMDRADLGLDRIAALLLDAKNEIISHQLGAPVADRIVHRAMGDLASAMAGAAASTLDRAEARRITTAVWADPTVEGSLLEALVSEGLLAEDHHQGEDGRGLDLIAMAFERLGDHLVISRQLDAIATLDDLATSLEAGPLRTLLALDGGGDPGLLEALSVEVAERFHTELVAVGEATSDNEAVLRAVVAGLAWRGAETITDETKKAILSSLSRPAIFRETMDRLLRLAPRPGYAVNGDWLGELLAARSMADRDRFLAPFLHDTHDTDGAVDQLVAWARDSAVTTVSAEVCRLWTSTLLWCAGAPDRRVRDAASVGAARLLSHHPQVASELVANFISVDDDWIVERALLAAYTALLRGGTPDDWGATAQAVYDNVFTGNVPTNALIRDAARSILEGAHQRDALPGGVDIEAARPPYASDWPPRWPSSDELVPFDDHDRFPRLVYSSTGDDFFTYQITPLLRGLDGVDAAAVARRIVLDVVELGYDPDTHGRFDGYLVSEYGGGRGKPSSIERIGKKYQWIALARLLGVIRDHNQPAPSSWELPPDPTDLQGVELRDLDLTFCAPLSDASAEQPWVDTYDWNASRAEPNEAWVIDDDIPEIDLDNADLRGRRAVVLSGHYDWEPSGTDAEPGRRIWTQLSSLLVASDNLAALLDELEGRRFAGDSEVQPPMVYRGFIADYPFGRHHQRQLAQIDHDRRGPAATPTSPSAYQLLGEYGYAPDELSTVSLDAPAPQMFGRAPGELRWDGGGWSDGDRRVAEVRRIAGSNNELVVDERWLRDWLDINALALVWVEVSGKDVYTRGRGSPGGLLRTRVSHLGTQAIETLDPVHERFPTYDGT